MLSFREGGARRAVVATHDGATGDDRNSKKRTLTGACRQEKEEKITKNAVFFAFFLILSLKIKRNTVRSN